MNRRRIAVPAGALLGAFIAALGAVSLPSPASGATCALLGGGLDVQLAASERVTIAREGAALAVHTNASQPCALVALGEVDDVSITGTPGRDVVVVDLAGGPLEGGVEQEAGIGEVELIVDLNSGRGDRLVVRAPAAGGTLVAGDGGIALKR